MMRERLMLGFLFITILLILLITAGGEIIREPGDETPEQLPRVQTSHFRPEEEEDSDVLHQAR